MSGADIDLLSPLAAAPSPFVFEAPGESVEFNEVSREPELPPLAWSLSVTRHKLRVGGAVDVERDTCFEGACAGSLVEGYRFGSGVIRKSNSYVFLPPTHTLDGLYMVVEHGPGDITVTNSLVWALRTAGMTVASDEKRFAGIATNVRTASHGILGYRRLLLVTKQVSVFQMIYAPFVVEHGAYQEWPITLLPPQTRFTFESYKRGLIDVVQATLEYSPRFRRLLSTCSSGYDSPGCTALGKEVGLETALTIDTGRGGRDDSGERAAMEMGVPVRVYERPGNGVERFSERTRDWFVDLDVIAEATGEDYSEFIAALANHGDVYFKPFEEHLPGAVLLTGFHGAIWDFINHTGPWVRRGDCSGSGLNEFRLRVGFVHLPLPYVFARQAAAIQRLSQSAEMRPWQYGNPYNRPIPRRLAEEAGASRESFGIAKKAANVMIECKPEMLSVAYETVAARYPS